MTDYSIKELIKTFQEHEEKSRAENERHKKDYTERCPETPLPSCFTYDFSLPLALKAMCEEIQKLNTDL